MIVEQVRDAVQRRRPAGGHDDLPARPVVAMLSGGRDSVCLLDVAVALRAERERAGVARELRVARGGVRRGRAPLRGAVRGAGGGAGVVRARREQGEAGNLQAWAREVRYGAAIELAER